MTHTFRFIPVIVAAAALFTPLTGHAQTSPFSVSFDVSGQTALSGNVHGGGTGSVLGLGTQVTPKSYGDVYGPGLMWRAALGYRVGERGEIRMAGGYTAKASQRLQVGTVANLPLFAKFDDYKAFDLDFGYRHYVAEGRARPFVGAFVGLTRIAETKSEFSVPQANVVLPNVDFFQSSTVPAFGLGGGVMFDLTDRVAVQGGADFRWHGDATGKDGLAGTGLESINDESRRWTVPITAGLTLRF